MRRGLPILGPFLTVAALALAVCTPSEAQGRRMRTRVVSGPPRTQVVRMSPSGINSVSNPAGNFSPTVTTAHSGNSVERLLLGDYPAPGLGFDYTHLAAVNRNLSTRALIDPATQHRLALERQIRRETPVASGPAFPVVVNSIVVNVAPQPPVVIVQEPEAEPEYERLQRARYLERLEQSQREEVPAAPLYEPPLRESDELVFIRRDGSLVFAVGFVARGERLIYITREGHRRSLPIVDLDLAATREMNEARGTSLQLQ